MSAVTFFVPGIPQPQGSKTGFVQGGRAVVVDKNPKLLKPWRKAVTEAARATWAHHAPLDGPIRLYAAFVIVRPASVRREYPHVRPDLDKYLRSLMDGITDAKCVWRDDSQVVQIESSKVYGAVPGVHVVIERVGNLPAVEAAAA